MATPPRVLTIAGSDSGGGAGIQADLKTIEALHCYGASAVTAVTAQNTVAVGEVVLIPAATVVRQIEMVLDDIGADAIKIGMLGSPDTVQAVAAVLNSRPPVATVLDPVMVAKSGDSLLADEAVAAVVEVLLPLVTLVTPNLPEAERICGHAVADHESRIAAAKELVDLGASAALVKGGHGSEPLGDESSDESSAGSSTGSIVDWFYDGSRLHRFENERIPSRSDHGTGCTLSAAIACELASGVALPRAVELGLSYLRRALGKAVPLGKGRGPLNHGGRYRFQER